jgi:ATP-dependent DNA helicase RecQ
MKLKMMECKGEMVLVVVGKKQGLIIREEEGGFTFELLEESRPCEEVNLPSVPVFKKDISEEAPAEEEEAEIAFIKETARKNDLFHTLSDLRRQLAAAEKVPPYMIFHDKTLWGMIEKMPVELSALGHISGVGKSKLDKYGAQFLAIINGAA